MENILTLYNDLIGAMSIKGLEIPLTAVSFFKQGDKIPKKVLETIPENITLTSCQAAKQASLGDAVLLTIENIGCVAAAITLGLVDKNQDYPIGESIVYTDIMREQSGLGKQFAPPSPKEFTDGTVYSCNTSGRSDYCLFGKEDSGRFKDRETAQRAIEGMMAIQPPIMKGVFLFSKDFSDLEITPDVVVLSVRPVELTRIIQGYQYRTGKRVNSSMGPLRVVNSDLIVRPYLTGEMNVSSYCLGARLVAQYESDRLGIGMPFDVFKETVQGVVDSEKGYPFHLYPGASI